MSSFLAILMEFGKIRDPYLSQPMRNACQTNVLSAAFSLIFRVPLWPAPATATKASARYAHIVLPTNGKRSLLCVIFPPPLSPASKILNLIWITSKLDFGPARRLTDRVRSALPGKVQDFYHITLIPPVWLEVIS
jgi:hypothetical protein